MSRHRINDPDETAYLPRVVDAPARSTNGHSGPALDEPFSATFSHVPPEEPAVEAVSADPAITSVAPVMPSDSTTVLPVIRVAPDETTVLTAIKIDADQTTTLPRIPAADETGLLGAVPPAPPSDGADVKPPPRWSGEPQVPKKAIRSGDGYRSIHAEYTRTTVGSVIRTTLRGTGELLITLGVVVMLFAAYEVWGKTAIVENEQSIISNELDESWERPDPRVSPSPGEELKAIPGHGLARMYIPRIEKQWVVVEGVTQADIRFAPGHYPNSAMPGQKGNFSVAGHRNKATFWNLHQLKDGDEIVVETKKTWYVYKVVKIRIVKPHQVEVVRPTPPGFTTGQRLLTLTTCNPLYNNYERLIIHAELDSKLPRGKDLPRPSVLES